MLRFLYNRVCNGRVPARTPLRLPYEGLYHPDHGHIQDAEAYRSSLNPANPTVGIWFYQNFCTSYNKAHIDAMDDHVYRRFAERVPLDPELAAWMKEVSPYALHNIIDKLLDAAGRGMWQADVNTLEALREAYLAKHRQPHQRYRRLSG